MTNQIYVVVGMSGDYESRNWWIVKAFVDEYDAVAFSVDAKQEADRLHNRWNKRMSRYLADKTGKVPAPKRRPRPTFDYRMWSESGGDAPSYGVQNVPFVGEAK